MTEREFCIWFKGMLDAFGDTHITPDQMAMVKERLDVTLRPKSPNAFASVQGQSSRGLFTDLGINNLAVVQS